MPRTIPVAVGMELEKQPGCHVWNSDLQASETVTWTSICAGSTARGTGTIKRIWNDGKSTVEATGRLLYGKRQGDRVVRETNGDVSEGPYVAGLKHGLWVEHRADGGVWKGQYLYGEMDGDWLIRNKDGSTSNVYYRHGAAYYE